MEESVGAVTFGVRVSGKEEESVCASMEFPEEAYVYERTSFLL
jgi:hypothetical protein